MSGQLGMGVMIDYMYGDRGDSDALKAALGQKIAGVSITKDDRLNIKLQNGKTLSIWDNGQSCCEHRYLDSDDEATFDYYVDAVLMDIDLRDGGDLNAEDTSGWSEPHDVMFLDIRTSKGIFACCTHNEHNGYYGGFSFRCSLEDSE